MIALNCGRLRGWLSHKDRTNSLQLPDSGLHLLSSCSTLSRSSISPGYGLPARSAAYLAGFAVQKEVQVVRDRKQVRSPLTAAVHALQARKNLQLVRGTKDVDKEFNDLVEFAKLAAQCKHPWRTLFSKKYRPQLILSACSTGFQQWTG